MNISKDWGEFIKYFKRKFGQQEFDFGDNELLEPMIREVIPVGEFNRNLNGLLSVPPPKKNAKG